MPHPGPLDALRARLQAEMSPRHVSHALPWGNPRVMTDALHSVQREFGGDGGGPPTDDLLKSSLQKFVKTHQVGSFTELKYVCYGITVPTGNDMRRLVDKSILFNELLGLVAAYEVQPKQFRRCYQGLLTGYFGFDRSAAPGRDSVGNWKRLRGYLNDHLLSARKTAKARGVIPDWLQTLYAHKNLLTDDPCSRYIKGLQRSDPSELTAVCGALGITSSSWVWEEALIAYVRAICADSEPNFKKRLPALLKMVNGEFEIKLPGSLSIQAVSLAVTRYSRCADMAENIALRDTCLHWIGNPWINRTAWDAHVKHEPARQMVNGWLKRRLIKDFFELLAQDGSADLRRLNYWLKWEPQISDMWFVLGAQARDNHGSAFMELRKRMAGRDRVLWDSNPLNNAFVMRIGQLLVIEFGVTGNACYVFAASDFRTSLEKKYLNISELKQKISATRLRHHSHWEGTFDSELRSLLQTIPMLKGEMVNTTSDSGMKGINAIKANESKGVAATALQIKEIQSIFGKKISVSPDALLDDPLPKQNSKVATNSEPLLTDIDLVKIKFMCVRNNTKLINSSSIDGLYWVPVTNKDFRPRFSKSLYDYGFKYVTDKGFCLKAEYVVENSKSSDGYVDVSNETTDSLIVVEKTAVNKNSDLFHILRMCERNGIEIEDNRGKGGALWLLVPDLKKLRYEFQMLIDRYNFRYSVGKGYWLK